MSQDLITVSTYRTEPEAEADKAYLEEEGIQVFMADAESVTGALGNAVTSIKLQVPNTEVERATVLLDALRQRQKQREETEGSLEEDEETPLKCLSCGAPMNEADAQCAKCGWSYAEGEGA